MPTKIEWCDESWNPVTGCTPAGEGCLNCYAKGIASRFWGDRKFSEVQSHADRMENPYHWRKPRRIFVCSMGDLFHKHVSGMVINNVWLTMINSNRHTFIILTKLPERMREWTKMASQMKAWPIDEIWPSHIHLGVSVSTQNEADMLIPILRDIPAATRIVSFEPALEDIYMAGYLVHNDIQGVIMGCESGPGRRLFDKKWAKHMRDQAVRHGIPFFLKQMPDSSGKVVKMPELDGKVWDQLPGRE